MSKRQRPRQRGQSVAARRPFGETSDEVVDDLGRLGLGLRAVAQQHAAQTIGKLVLVEQALGALRMLGRLGGAHGRRLALGAKRKAHSWISLRQR